MKVLNLFDLYFGYANKFCLRKKIYNIAQNTLNGETNGSGKQNNSLANNSKHTKVYIENKTTFVLQLDGAGKCSCFFFIFLFFHVRLPRKLCLPKEFILLSS